MGFFLFREKENIEGYIEHKLAKKQKANVQGTSLIKTKTKIKIQNYERN